MNFGEKDNKIDSFYSKYRNNTTPSQQTKANHINLTMSYAKIAKVTFNPNDYLIPRGAKWGEVNEDSHEEILAAITARKGRKPVIPEPEQEVFEHICNNCYTGANTVRSATAYGKVCIPCWETLTNDGTFEPVMPPAQCAGCVFRVHTNPPEHFTIKDKPYCCTTCRTSQGKYHGGKCQKEVYA